MYRFKTLNEYDKRIDQLTEEIKWHKNHRSDCHIILDCELLKQSYIVEKKDFISTTKESLPGR